MLNSFDLGSFIFGIVASWALLFLVMIVAVIRRG